tara:strand:+ start:248 stop:475 length:228 start_codon:yes stop_codon:yes gene_type:complete
MHIYIIDPTTGSSIPGEYAVTNSWKISSIDLRGATERNRFARAKEDLQTLKVYMSSHLERRSRREEKDRIVRKDE